MGSSLNTSPFNGTILSADWEVEDEVLKHSFSFAFRFFFMYLFILYAWWLENTYNETYNDSLFSVNVFINVSN